MIKIKLTNLLIVIAALFAVFSLGFVSAISIERLNPSVPDTVYVIGEEEFIAPGETDFLDTNDASNEITGFLFNIFGNPAAEVASPSDWISEEQIKVYGDRVVIELDNAYWATFTDTNSMDPVIDKGANAIEVVPESAEQIKPGDIVAYESKYAEGTIIHRVVSVGYDSEGWYAKVKGDNIPSEDPGKIRFDQIKRVVVAIVY